MECIRCGKCKNVCPTQAIGYYVFDKPMKKNKAPQETQTD